MRYGLSQHFGRALVGDHSSSNFHRRSIDETTGAVFGGQQALDLGPQFWITATRTVEKRRALGRRARPCGLKEVFDSLPAFRGHSIADFRLPIADLSNIPAKRRASVGANM